MQLRFRSLLHSGLEKKLKLPQLRSIKGKFPLTQLQEKPKKPRTNLAIMPIYIFGQV